MNSIYKNFDAENSVSTRRTREFGDAGEELATAFLRRQKFRIAMANFTAPVGRNRRGVIVNAEIDLIAYEAETLCFIEVKTRRAFDSAPEAAVNLRKQRQIIRAARVYRKIFRLEKAAFRYDVVSVILPDDAPPQIELFRNFWTESKFSKRRWTASDFSF